MNPKAGKTTARLCNACTKPVGEIKQVTDDRQCNKGTSQIVILRWGMINSKKCDVPLARYTATCSLTPVAAAVSLFTPSLLAPGVGHPPGAWHLIST